MYPSAILLETADLLDRIRAGDQEARGDLLQRYRRQLDLFLRARLPVAARGLSETQDIVQDVCIKALPYLDRFEYRGIGSFWAYLRRIALNHLADVWRRFSSGVTGQRLPQETWCAPASPDATPLEGLLDREQFEAFEAVIGNLPERRRYSLLMRIELGLEYGIIAKECEYPSPDAARMDVRRTMEIVGREMAGDAA